MPSATAPKPATKPAAKTAAKPAAKSSAKSGTKPVANPAPKATIKATIKAASSSKATATSSVTGPSIGGGKSDKAVSVDSPMLRSRDLVARVAEATGAKVKDVRQAVEATLAELGKALDQGQTLQLPPLGKLSVAPRKGADDMSPIKLKLRRSSDPAVKKASKKEALAEPDEAS